MLTVHHLAQSQSERIVWLCEELGLPYQLIRYDRAPSGAAPAAYKALSPFGSAPVLTDGVLVLGESGAIVEYLLRRHGGARLLPGPEDPAWTQFLFWFHFANGSYIPGLMLDHHAPPGAAPNPDSRSERAYRLIETRLGEAAWFAGDAFTSADIMMCLPRFAARRDLAGSPNTAAYVQRVRARPAWQAALAKAEPAA
jgi:glutathione S-transferase